MAVENGRTIGQAIQVLRKTYRELNSLRDDFQALLSERVGSGDFEVSEYSYSPNTLYLKPYHLVAFKRTPDPSDTEQAFLVLACMFYDDGDFKLIAADDQPELYACALRVSNSKDALRASLLWELLKDSDHPSPKRLVLGGEVAEYSWKGPRSRKHASEVWREWWVAYPLVEITDKAAMEAKILDKLLPPLLGSGASANE